MARWALRSFAEATSFIAEVIFSVLRTDPILSLISRSDATAPPPYAFCASSRHRSAASCSITEGASSGIRPSDNASRIS